MIGHVPNKDTTANGITTIGETTGHAPVPDTMQNMIGMVQAGARDMDMAGITPKGITATVGRRCDTIVTMTATHGRTRTMARIPTAMFRRIA